MPQRVDEPFLTELIQAIAMGDTPQVTRLLSAHQHLARAGLHTEAFCEEIVHQLYAGDTPLHVAAAALNLNIAATLLTSGADVGAKNRRGAEPLLYAATSSRSKYWPRRFRYTCV